MRIDWEHETFESGLETWNTQFRGMVVEIRRNPGDEKLEWTVAGGDLSLFAVYDHFSPSEAMTAALKWVNGYWDLLEDGPVQYEVLPPEIIGE